MIESRAIGSRATDADWSGAAFGDPVLWTFAALATLACRVESAATAGRPLPDPAAAAVPSEAPGWLPYATGGALLLTFWAGLAGRDPEPGAAGPAAVLGGLIFAAGIRLRARAISALGAGFTNKVRWVAGRRLVTEGIYARLRHPSEAGTLCLGLGSAALLGSGSAAATALLLLAPLVALRIRAEDRMLARVHGDAYREYARAVPRLVPRPRRPYATKATGRFLASRPIDP